MAVVVLKAFLNLCSAVGNIVVQYAKKVIGASKVIAITSSASKCQWLTELGADCALDYNDSTFSNDLDRATEGFVDTYFDKSV
jgi:NADPH-dependent curcumin reductase CurA